MSCWHHGELGSKEQDGHSLKSKSKGTKSVFKREYWTYELELSIRKWRVIEDTGGESKKLGGASVKGQQPAKYSKEAPSPRYVYIG